MYQNTEAIVLKRRRFSETSLLLTLFTRDFGRVEALAKGARRLRSPLKGHFDLFSREEVVIFHRPRAGLDLGVEASLVREHENIRRRPGDFALAGIIAELLCTGNMVRDPHQEAYDSAARALEALDLQSNALAGVIAGIMGILRDYGFMPRLEQCVCCGRTLPVQPRLCGRHGGVACARCAGDGTELTPGELLVLRRLNLGNDGRLSLKGCRQGGGNLLAALAGYCRHILEKPLRSFDVFFELAKIRGRSQLTRCSQTYSDEI